MYNQGWEAVGGLSEVVQQLKEMVLLPLMYPEVFQAMHLTPPRSVLYPYAKLWIQLVKCMPFLDYN